MRLRIVEGLQDDARLYTDPDGITVVAVPPDLLSPHAERVVRHVLGLLGEKPEKVAVYGVPEQTGATR